jgi:hypothetical protein
MSEPSQTWSYGFLQNGDGEDIGMAVLPTAEKHLHTPGENCHCEPECSPLSGKDRLGVMVKHKKLIA